MLIGFFFFTERCTRFNPDILKQRDCNNDLISDWCTSGFKPEEGLCTVCDMTIKCNQHGVSAVKRHAELKKHVENCNKIRDSSGQIKICPGKIGFNAKEPPAAH